MHARSPIPESDKPPRRAYLLAAALLAAAMAALLVDGPVARFCRPASVAGSPGSGRIPGDLRKLLSLSEVFAHGAGVALICLAWYVLDPARRRSLPRALVCAYGAGLWADLFKLFVGRTRPNAFDFSGEVAQSFVGWFPAFHSGDWAIAIDRNLQSWPSGHSATAAGLALVLAHSYPRGKWFFALLAILAMLQRVESGAHFPSDTLSGAALGCLWAGLCLDPRLLGRVFQRFEGV